MIATVRPLRLSSRAGISFFLSVIKGALASIGPIVAASAMWMLDRIVCRRRPKVLTTNTQTELSHAEPGVEATMAGRLRRRVPGMGEWVGVWARGG